MKRFIPITLALLAVALSSSVAFASSVPNAYNEQRLTGGNMWVRQDTRYTPGYSSPVRYATHSTAGTWLAAQRHNATFQITHVRDITWQYPYIGSGYQQGYRPDCPHRTSLCYQYPLPEGLAEHATATVGAWLAPGAYNYAFDMWFARHYASHAYPGDTEVMVWEASPGLSESLWRHVRVDGIRYGVMSWITNHHGHSWRYVAYVRDDRWGTSYNHGMQLTRHHLGAFMQDARHHGYLSRSSWLQAIDLGFELVHGGTGNNIHGYHLDDLPITRGGK